jgi:hypothetical protein
MKNEGLPLSIALIISAAILGVFITLAFVLWAILS